MCPSQQAVEAETDAELTFRPQISEASKRIVALMPERPPLFQDAQERARKEALVGAKQLFTVSHLSVFCLY